MGVAWIAHTGPLAAFTLSLSVLSGPVIAYLAIENPRTISVIYGITATLMGALLVHFGRGPLQIEMHFYFFVLLAMLCVFANPAVNLAAAASVAVYHLLVWRFLPASAFNDNAQWWVVLVRVGFVALETVAACYISRSFFDGVISLEKKVESRTAATRQQQRDMHLILNNMQEGLVTIDLDGHVAGETSRAIKDWFGSPLPGEALAYRVGRRDAAFGNRLAQGLGALKQGTLPAEAAIGLLPTRLRNGSKTFAVQYRLMSPDDYSLEAVSQERRAGGEQPEKVLVMIADITEQLRREAAERHLSDLLKVFRHIILDRTGFLEFKETADRMVHSLTASSPDAGLEHHKQIVHTLKENSAMFGLTGIAELCQKIESDLAQANEALAATYIDSLGQAWHEICCDVDRFLGEPLESGIEIDRSEYTAVLSAMKASVDVSTLSRMVESWRLEPAAKFLSRIEHQIREIAESRGKRNIRVSIESNDLRFDSDRFAPFWSAFIHVLRDMVDHGVEKPEESSIKLSTAIEGEYFVVTLLLYLPGLSASDATAHWAALADACAPLEGTMEVESERGIATSIRFRFPKDQSVYEGHAALLAPLATY
jgi:HPt (histidine-containing phosphotransfer) domain-containing protein